MNYLDATPGNNISSRKLPEGEFITREHLIDLHNFPVWFSLDSSAALLNRNAPLLATRPVVPRLDFAPHLTTSLAWGGIRLVPTVGIRETYYGSSFTQSGVLTGNDLVRSSREALVELILPSVERVFDAKSIWGDKIKHVLEPRVTYTNVSGIDDFSRIVRFDGNDILANTNQVEFSLVNRLLAKDKNGTVSDLLTWRIWYDRYFDPTFGGAIIPQQRNIVQSELNLTGYAYLDGQRHSSPIVSSLRLQSRIGMEWRTDYDPLQHRLVNNTITADTRVGLFAFFASETALRTNTVLAPSANQFWGRVAYGSQNRRGISYGFDSRYDFRTGVMQYLQAQATYNTDCCGFSLQVFRWDFVTRQDTGFRLSFALSNIGTVGNLRQQDRIF